MAAQMLTLTKNIHLPVSIAPFTVGVIPPKPGSHEHEEGYPLALELAAELDKVTRYPFCTSVSLSRRLNQIGLNNQMSSCLAEIA